MIVKLNRVDHFHDEIFLGKKECKASSLERIIILDKKRF